METIENILKMWETDAVIDQTEPSKELIKIPKLHSKYLGILTKHKIASKKAHFDYLRMRKVKWEYFTGKLSQEELQEYGWEPFQFTLKSDISTYLEADKDLIKLLEKKIYHEETVSVVESIMNELKNRHWELKSFIDWERFIGGQ
jgi:hypothetical protein